MGKTRHFLSKISSGVIFSILALFIILYGVFSTAIVRQLEDEKFTYRENFAWAVFQIQRQFLEIERYIEYARVQNEIATEDFEQVLLEYEILVSRILLVKQGKGFQVLLQIPEVTSLLAILDEKIARIDAMIAKTSNQSVILNFIHDELEPIDDPLQQAVVRTTNFVSVYNANNIASVKTDIQILSYLFFSGMIVMIGLAVFVIRHRQRAFAADVDARRARQEQEVIEEAADYAKMHALGTLAGGVAHEINTPAQYLQNNLEFLSDSFDDVVKAVRTGDADGTVRLELDRDRIDFLTEEIPLAIRESIQGLDRIAEIVRGIRKFAHPTTDSVERISIAEEIETAITLTRNQVKHVAELEQNYATDVREVEGRRNHLSQALINLIVNASQAIRESGKRPGKIWLDVISDTTDVFIRLRDNGGGVPEELRDRIFDYFFTTKERGVGTGQGLPICRKLIQDDFNGDLTLSEASGDGAEFIIRIPKPGNRQAGHDQCRDRAAIDEIYDIRS
ncbi:sensor histidine kinase [Thalassospira xianhensis]|uniref:histidine kinase n=1 Tax=Thalassospira xianhensis MCCC 1A02616 TaxID=1177929 RepID=A0A367U863_9PROT|nr:ATP-binding protein [Thalassospira xianhensis]RCK04507.1 histidine kinase [Thalassospira xianhensis MCCC 1A02616]